MSGAEAIAVIGAISSVISLVQTIQQAYEAAQTASGLGEEFQRVADKMPVVLATFQDIKCHQEGQQAIYLRVTDPAIKSSMENKAQGVKLLVASCEASLAKIKSHLDDAMPAPGASRSRRLATAFRTQVAPGRVKKVQALMADVLGVLVLLHDSFGYDRNDSDNRAQELKVAAQEMANPPGGLEEGCTQGNYNPVFYNSAAAKIGNQGNNSGQMTISF